MPLITFTQQKPTTERSTRHLFLTSHSVCQKGKFHTSVLNLLRSVKTFGFCPFNRRLHIQSHQHGSYWYAEGLSVLTKLVWNYLYVPTPSRWNHEEDRVLGSGMEEVMKAALYVDIQNRKTHFYIYNLVLYKHTEPLTLISMHSEMIRFKGLIVSF